MTKTHKFEYIWLTVTNTHQPVPKEVRAIFDDNKRVAYRRDGTLDLSFANGLEASRLTKIIEDLEKEMKRIMRFDVITGDLVCPPQ